MIDTEIKKALDICSKSNNGCSYSKYACKDCYLNGQPMCSSVLIQDTIDLINRYEKEKNKAWELFKKKCDENSELQMICDKQKAEVEKLNKIILKGDFSSITALRAREHWFRQNTEHINRLNAEIERLKKELLQTKLEKHMLVETIEEAKAEAYKEVADNIERAFSKTESQIPNIEVVEKTVQICRNAIRKVLNELVSDGDAHE